MCMGHLDSGGHTGLVASVLERPIVIVWSAGSEMTPTGSHIGL